MDTMLTNSDLNFDFALSRPIADAMGASVEDKPDSLTLPPGGPIVGPILNEPLSFEVSEGDTLVASLIAFHLEGEPLTWSITGGEDAALFSIAPVTGEVTFNAAPDFDNPLDVGRDNDYFLNVQVSDGENVVRTTILVTVLTTGTSQFVYAFDDSAELNRMFGSRDFDVLANDLHTDGQPLSVTRADLLDPSSGSISVNHDQTVRFEPAPGFSGDAIISYVVSDAFGAMDTADLTVTVSANFSPFIVEPVSFQVDAFQTNAANLQAFDLEGDPITWSISGGPDAALFEIDPTSGQLAFISPPDPIAPLDVGADNSYELTVRASDPFDSTDQAILVSVVPSDGPDECYLQFDLILPDPGDYLTVFLSDASQGDLFAFPASSPCDVPIEYRLFGEDADLFDLNPDTGMLSLPDPVPGLRGSFDTDNHYELIVQVSSGELSTATIEVILPLFAAG